MGLGGEYFEVRRGGGGQKEVGKTKMEEGNGRNKSLCKTQASLLGKAEGVLAGVPFFDEVFRQLNCTYAKIINNN